MNIPTFPLHAETELDSQFDNPTIEESTIETTEDNRLNYIGIGGALGLRDDSETALGEGGFSIRVIASKF
ncbi:MAG: hypothetical protein ACFCAD_20175 [Pleurocapsa sp.]